jgi:hypothetical protein
MDGGVLTGEFSWTGTVSPEKTLLDVVLSDVTPSVNRVDTVYTYTLVATDAAGNTSTAILPWITGQNDVSGAAQLLVDTDAGNVLATGMSGNVSITGQLVSSPFFTAMDVPNNELTFVSNNPTVISGIDASGVLTIIDADTVSITVTHTSSGKKAILSLTVLANLPLDVSVDDIQDTEVSLALAPHLTAFVNQIEVHVGGTLNQTISSGLDLDQLITINGLTPGTDYTIELIPDGTVYGTTPVYLTTKATPGYTVTYSEAGKTAGTAPIDPNPYQSGETASLLDVPNVSERLQNANGQVLGFSTQPNGGGTRLLYGAAAQQITVSADVTLHPVWPAAVAAITIDTQPAASTSFMEGGIATLTVTATVAGGATLSYQWYANTTASNSGGTPILGATSSSFALPRLGTDTYYYYVVITSSDGATATSDVAVVTVTSVPYPTIQRTVTIAATANGRVTTNWIYAPSRQVVTLTFIPAEGYELDTVTVHRTGSETSTVPLSGEGNIRTFVMPPYEVTVRATFKEKSDTGIDTPQANTLEARVIDGVLHISGLEPGETFAVYNMQGHLLYKRKATAAEEQIRLSGSGVYIVTSRGRVVKVMY